MAKKLVILRILLFGMAKVKTLGRTIDLTPEDDVNLSSLINSGILDYIQLPPANSGLKEPLPDFRTHGRYADHNLVAKAINQGYFSGPYYLPPKNTNQNTKSQDNKADGFLDLSQNKNTPSWYMDEKTQSGNGYFDDPYHGYDQSDGFLPSMTKRKLRKPSKRVRENYFLSFSFCLCTSNLLLWLITFRTLWSRTHNLFLSFSSKISQLYQQSFC